MTPKEARWKFIRAVRMIIMQITLNRGTAEVEEEDQVLSFNSHIEGVDGVTIEQLTFDKKYFRAKRETRITQDVKNVLSLEQEDRTPAQLQLALHGLQSISSFAEYPLHIQEKLVRVAFFYNIPAKRVIIREGHNAEIFYFLITGSAAVTCSGVDPVSKEPTAKVVQILRKGECFGERELLHSIKRTHTITAEVPCELIAIEMEDFFDMFMGEGDHGKEMEHLKFLRILPFLKGWPVRKLNDHPQMGLFHYFKRGAVISTDSNQSDWLYIVKSGSCQVIKELSEARPGQQRRSSTILDPNMNEKFAPNGLNVGPKIDSRRRRSSVKEPDLSSLRVPSSLDDTRSRDGDKKVVFVQLDMLLPKDVFGLPFLCSEAGIIDARQPSLSLVSRGAEVIMLNKRFFLEHANQYVIRHLKEIVRPYPLQETLQEHLQAHTDWQHYKQQTLSTVVTGARRKSVTQPP
ncbi:cyclic nucleotide-binding domain-containing protein 2-like isoform X1 [Acanthaster planci]|uniref:Cyclic nucleotide-binding domain-containing protein 2-like isoform X1 n=1 Tax=Acanthaster planci TaxID=133434 RepID=A0A8B7XIK9_ACAPL|nr:cyclic nucleotide-binding domain-containing protein 2-like isoform X1 [Acanthaster planci]